MNRMPKPLDDPAANLLLAALRREDLTRWLPHLDPVDLRVGEVLHEMGRAPRWAYFPVTAVVSLLVPLQDGRSDDVCAVGREGMSGVALFMDGGASTSRAVVQGAGRAFRVHAAWIQEEFANSVSVMHLLLGYTMARSAELAQNVVCGRHHTTAQRLCRRLLQALDPSSLTNLGLAASLEILAREFEKGTGIATRLILNDVEVDDAEVDGETQLAIYRVVQESLNNISKYAGAREAGISMLDRGADVIIAVRDDGRGFDTAAAGPASHGLAGMRHRLQACAGELTVSSIPGAGTAVQQPLHRVPHLADARARTEAGARLAQPTRPGVALAGCGRPAVERSGRHGGGTPPRQHHLSLRAGHGCWPFPTERLSTTLETLPALHAV